MLCPVWGLNAEIQVVHKADVVTVTCRLFCPLLSQLQLGNLKSGQGWVSDSQKGISDRQCQKLLSDRSLMSETVSILSLLWIYVRYCSLYGLLNREIIYIIRA